MPRCASNVKGTRIAPQAAPSRSEVSNAVNTPFVERQNTGDRGRNARKVRKTSRFGKAWEAHAAMTDLTK